MIETEYKVMLTKEQYEKIHGMFAWTKQYTQVNYYYDTAELSLAQAHVTCRVRHVGGEYLLQMKFPTDKLQSRIELEEKLGDTLPEELTSDMLCTLSERSDMPDVKLLGGLTTLRSAKDFGGAEIDLDKSEYFGRTDYELEIEFTDEALAGQLMAEIAEKADVHSDELVCRGKLHRFLDEWKKST